ncbi:MAG: twin-arginine translocation signal domain-containing protein, partial [Pseudomonadota bacterium]
MDRRSFLKKSTIGAGAVAASSTLAAPALAQGAKEMT